MLRSPVMNVMQAAALKAGKALRRDFMEQSSLSISRKGPGDFVSEADKRAEQTLFQELSKARPGYGFLMEEAGVIDGTDKTHRFIIDPLDGTTNFLHSIGHFAISIALEREDEIVASLIYNPISEEMFMAEKGQGAFLMWGGNRDHYRLRVSPREEFLDSVFACGIPHVGRGNHALFLKELAIIMPKCAGIRRMGAASLDLAFVAAGRVEGYWERNLYPWDMAAGMLVVRESGGFYSDFNGGSAIFESRGIVAGNHDMQKELLKLLK